MRRRSEQRLGSFSVRLSCSSLLFWANICSGQLWGLSWARLLSSGCWIWAPTGDGITGKGSGARVQNVCGFWHSPFLLTRTSHLLFAQFLCDTGTKSVFYSSSSGKPCSVQVAQERNGTREKQELKQTWDTESSCPKVSEASLQCSPQDSSIPPSAKEFGFVSSSVSRIEKKYFHFYQRWNCKMSTSTWQNQETQYLC